MSDFCSFSYLLWGYFWFPPLLLFNLFSINRIVCFRVYLETRFQVSLQTRVQTFQSIKLGTKDFVSLMWMSVCTILTVNQTHTHTLIASQFSYCRMGWELHTFGSKSSLRKRRQKVLIYQAMDHPKWFRLKPQFNLAPFGLQMAKNEASSSGSCCR